MQSDLNKYNYLQLDVEELPSRGLYYPAGTKIKGRFLNLRDIKFIALITEGNATVIVNEIIERCFIFEKITIDDILLCDREYLAFWLRANSFIANNGFKIGIKKCSKCGINFEKEIRLEELDINYLQDFLPVITLPDSNIKLALKLPKIKDLRIKDDDKEIQYIARMIEHDDPLNLIYNLSAYDYAFLSDVISAYKIGFVFDLQIFCPHCNQLHYVKASIDDTNMFAQLNIRDIYRMILNCTKYTTYKIDDDISWPELEIISDVVNEMVKKENEEMQKQQAAANAKASAMKSKYSSSSYHGHH